MPRASVSGSIRATCWTRFCFGYAIGEVCAVSDAARGRLRAFLADFNEPRDDLTVSVNWWEDAPSVGEEVLLVDEDWDVTLGRVREITIPPDKDTRTDGLLTCESDYSRWLDGDHVLTLALDRLQQMTSAAPVLKVRLG